MYLCIIFLSYYFFLSDEKLNMLTKGVQKAYIAVFIHLNVLFV